MLQGFIEPAEMHAVDKAVVDLDGETQRLTVILPDIFAPGDAGDGVVLVKIPLVRAAGKVEPRQAEEVDEVIGLRGGLEKRGLPLAFLLRRAAEGGKRRIPMLIIWLSMVCRLGMRMLLLAEWWLIALKRIKL